jgi:hypothetical protein
LARLPRFAVSQKLRLGAILLLSIFEESASRIFENRNKDRG